jgi:hypothetical protein
MPDNYAWPYDACVMQALVRRHHTEKEKPGPSSDDPGRGGN